MGQPISTPLRTSDETATPYFYPVLTGYKATLALQQAELGDGYEALCKRNLSNRQARFSSNYMANSSDEASIQRNQALLNTYRAHLPPPLAALKAQVVLLMPSADGGMPHTRPDHLICVPDRPAFLPFETFCHELWHIHQRAHYGQWKTFFEKAWSFQIYKGAIPSSLQGVLRINPDTMADPLWIWKDTWIPLCVFLNPVSPRLDQTAVWFYNVRTQRHIQTPPPDMAAFFGTDVPAVAYEHPCELAAYLATSTSESPARQAFVKHFLT